MFGPRNKHAMILRYWWSGNSGDIWDYDSLSDDYNTKARSLFSDDDLAHLFPGVKYKKDTEGERMLRCLASLKYQVSKSRFEWLVEMATKCMAEDQSLIKWLVEMATKCMPEDARWIELSPEDYRLIDSVSDSVSETDSHSIDEKIVVEDDSSEEEEENTMDSSDKKEEENTIDCSDDKEENTIVVNGSSEDSFFLDKFFHVLSRDYEGQGHKQLIEYADYMKWKVFPSQFNWMKMLKESSVKKMEKAPLAKVPYYFSERTKNWVNWQSVESLESFVLEILQTMCAEMTASRNGGSDIGSFLVLALVLQSKPDVLISVWPTIEENAEYRVEDKILVLAWVISQAYPKDWIFGVFMWVRYLLPLISSEPNLSPKSRDVIMQVIDRIGVSQAPYYTDPFDYNIGNGIDPSVKNGERVVPPLALELLARAAFPADSEQRKVTKTLRVRYRFLKKVALYASPGSENARRISEQIVPFALKAAGEGNSCLAKKARHLFFWCLKNHHHSFKQWDNMFLENLDGSIFMLEKLSVKCSKMLSRNLSMFGPMCQTMKSVASKNEEALADASRQATLEKAQNYAESILDKSHKYVGSTLGNPSDLLNVEAQTSEGNGFVYLTCCFAYGVALAYSALIGIDSALTRV